MAAKMAADNMNALYVSNQTTQDSDFGVYHHVLGGKEFIQCITISITGISHQIFKMASKMATRYIYNLYLRNQTTQTCDFGVYDQVLGDEELIYCSAIIIKTLCYQIFKMASNMATIHIKISNILVTRSSRNGYFGVYDLVCGEVEGVVSHLHCNKLQQKNSLNMQDGFQDGCQYKSQSLDNIHVLLL